VRLELRLLNFAIEVRQNEEPLAGKTKKREDEGGIDRKVVATYVRADERSEVRRKSSFRLERG